jgi:outer membrane protein assembly factor BamD
MKKLIIIISISLMFGSGCAWFKSAEEKTAQELASEGMSDYRDGSYKSAINAFKQLKDWYPFSKYAILAELKIADAYYQRKEYEEAVFAYEEFESLHPRNEAIPYVIYQTGRCHFEQIDSVDRDQANARKALETYRRLIRQFPKDTYAVKAEGDIKKCLKSLAGHDLYVGHYYFNGKHYQAALDRYKSILINYFDVGIHRQALKYIALCEAKIKAESEKE